MVPGNANTQGSRSAVIYFRISSLKQQDGYSVAAQLCFLRNHAEERGLRVIEEFIDIESAKEPGRKNFTQMMRLVARSKDIIILVEKTDRLYRSLQDYVLVEESGAEVHFIREGTIMRPDAVSHQRLVQGFQALLSRHYVLNLGEETRKGMLEKAKQGTFPSVAPLGYLNQDKRIVVDEMRKPIIRECFLLRGQGWTLDAITEYAHKAGLRTMRGKKVALSRIHRMLSDKFYYDVFTWHDKEYVGDHEPIVSKEEWNKAQPIEKKTTRHEHPFRGLLTCAECGHAVTAERQKGHVYFHCANRKKRCKWPWIRLEKLGEMLSEVASRISLSEEAAQIFYEALLATQNRKHEEFAVVRKRLAQERQGVQEKLEQVWGHHLEGRLTERMYDQLRLKYENELTDVEEREAHARDANTDFVEKGRKVLELCKGLETHYLTRSPAEQEKLLRVVCSNLTKDGLKLYPTFERPFDVLTEQPLHENWLPG